jgi:hypothetical protein
VPTAEAVSPEWTFRSASQPHPPAQPVAGMDFSTFCRKDFGQKVFGQKVSGQKVLGHKVF